MRKSSQENAKKIRELCLKLVNKANASHIGSALSIADLMAVLISNEEVCSLKSPNDKNRDRIILSKGHACVALYSALFLKGFFSRENLFTYGEDFSSFMNHASHRVPGVEFSTGALGHGLPVACGKAFAAKLKQEQWHNFVIMSDGELQEGSNWESILFASHHNLNNLTICIDYNNLQSLTSVDNTISLFPLDKKLISFGWETYVIDGHSHHDLYSILLNCKISNKPTAIIMMTTKGKGVKFMENKVEWHYKPPNQDQLKLALKLLKKDEK